ncbi:putative Addiction module toxin, RelE/StbE family [Vibrio nigripulchritudo SO65]|uniref:type II toxin-antitoxin system RelE family toxin n=1 Tax=Vibrio nigripulchritudo TaxID=28173 RepID=UPI0003B1A732|nr:type II toxin-antitoxin system RelE/ParE family toxin [Vibrio nigripulchritudo]CCN34585.1 putative Addiction module toxin, RelE/StbE family [Vibrio nigripulchritudo AM115]CCN40604.1 putative Addiction module toxin, RelE/StbE family [Vibrio nigripulchritudo FTn2]CCN66103.1 putative Addiction module toxin, RelE/StbE family [Vibrio nigripulchritudo POn4]CCN71206.1 putative Addiction module toxin, RelE/StbE family [Vibrio nigripulchritudo SFn118]CCN78593.1 putative Addiction module toxin, RelE/
MYNVTLHREARKDIKKLHPQIRKRVIDALEKIAVNPFLSGSKKLTGYVDIHRYRLSTYRIVYRVSERELEVLVLDAKPRGEVYKKY